MPKGSPHQARKNTRTASSAAAFSGCIGLPDTSGPVFNDGGLYAFARLFNERFDEIAANSRPEFRSTVKTEREFRIAS